MANIQEISSPADLTIHPDDRAATTAREAGTVINRFGREAGQTLGGAISHVGAQVGAEIDRHETMRAIAHGAATYSSLYGNLTQQWNDIASKADPNDVSVGQGFKEKALEPSLEKFQQAFEGTSDKAQQWALTRADEMRQHFFQKISADMSTRAGAAAHKNLADMERNYSNLVSNDPTALGHIVDSIKTDVEAIVSTGNLSSGDAAKIKSEIVPKMQQRVAQSAFDAMAQRNPNGAISALDHGDFNDYADAVTRDQWRKYAEGQAKIQKQDERQDRLQAAADFKDASAAKREDYIGKMYDQNSGRVLPVQPRLNQQINRDVQQGTMSRADANFLIRWNEQQYNAQVREDKIAAAGPPARDDAKVVSDLRKRVGDPDQPTTRQEVSDAMAAGHLTVKSAHDLAWRVGQTESAWQAMQRPFQQQFLNFKHVMMNSPTSLVKYLDPQQQIEKFNAVEADAQRIIRNAYDSRDKQLMRDVLDPKSSKWAFKEALSTLTTNPGAPVAAQAERIRGAGAPEAGEVREGWRYTGPGNDAKAAGKSTNWEKVEPSKADLIPK